MFENIKPLTTAHLPEYADVIRRSFATAAKDYGLTIENCPIHWSFITDEALAEKFQDGYYPFGLFVDNKIIGFVSLAYIDDGIYEMNALSVLPEYRHNGYGKLLLDFCKNKMRELGGDLLKISLADTDIILKKWYVANGFIQTGVKKFESLPLPVGYMEWNSEINE